MFVMENRLLYGKDENEKSSVHELYHLMKFMRAGILLQIVRMY